MVGVSVEGSWLGCILGKSLRGKDLVDVREVHLETVLVLVGLLGHPLELASVEKLFCGFLVDCEVAEGGLVFGALGEGTLCQVDVVGWAEEEHALAERKRVSLVGKCGSTLFPLEQHDCRTFFFFLFITNEMRHECHDATHVLDTSHDL